MINGDNASMLAHMTGKSNHVEAKSTTTTFNLVNWIRSKRLKWVIGHILRMTDTRLVKQALQHIFDNPQTGDLLMDTQADTWTQLQK